MISPHQSTRCSMRPLAVRCSKAPSAQLNVAKAIANMAFRQDVCWACGIVLYLFSKLADEDAQIFAFVTILRSPNGS
jgi:hypothetical protein